MPSAKQSLTKRKFKSYSALYGANWDIGDYYLVGFRADPNNYDVEMSVRPGMAPPESYTKLQLDIEHSLSTLRVIYSKPGDEKSPRFAEYLARLRNIARASLGQDQVLLGALALDTFKAEVVMREGSRIKNDYVKELGLYAVLFGGVAVALFVASDSGQWSGLIRDRAFLLLILGSMLGAWLSFSIRKPTLGFDDLAVIEQDRLEPWVRLLFVAGLTLIVGLFFATGLIHIKAGGFGTDFLASAPAATLAQQGAAAMRAILIGAMCGIGELLLPSVVNRQASAFLGALGGSGFQQLAGAAANSAAAARAAPGKGKKSKKSKKKK